MRFEHREVMVDYTDLSGCNYYDKTLTVTYALGVDQNGQLVVTQTNGVADNSVPPRALERCARANLKAASDTSVHERAKDGRTVEAWKA